MRLAVSARPAGAALPFRLRARPEVSDLVDDIAARLSRRGHQVVDYDLDAHGRALRKLAVDEIFQDVDLVLTPGGDRCRKAWHRTGRPTVPVRAGQAALQLAGAREPELLAMARLIEDLIAGEADDDAAR